MSLFQPSTKVISDACTEIADAVGASADAAMQNRASRSLNYALQHFNNRANWNFMLTEAAPVTVYAPFSVTGVTASAGQVSAACPAGHGILPEDMVSGGGFITGLRVSATAASGFGFYAPITTTGSQVITASFVRDTYALPTDWNNGYTFRLLVGNRALRPVGRRMYDRVIDSEQTVSTPYWYDLFLSGGKGRVRLLPPPVGTDVLLTRYYRRMTMVSTAGSGDTATLDIPQDYEVYLMSYAKWHFITDKAEGRGEQMKTWYALSQEGLVMMMRDQTKVPDEDLMFVPGAGQNGWPGDNSTRWLDWNYTG